MFTHGQGLLGLQQRKGEGSDRLGLHEPVSGLRHFTLSGIN